MTALRSHRSATTENIGVRADSTSVKNMQEQFRKLPRRPLPLNSKQSAAA